MIELALPAGERLRCRGLLLDMDGVLADSLATIDRHLRDWAREHGLDLRRALELAPGRTDVDLVALLAPHLDPQTEARRMIEREVAEAAGTPACLGAAELLAALPPGTWAVVTSGYRAVAHARLTAAGLPIPPVLITADDVQAGKPNPEGYESAARQLGLDAADCIVFEDAPAGLAAARAAGMRAIGIDATGSGRLSGLCDVVVRSLAEVSVSVMIAADETVGVRGQ